MDKKMNTLMTLAYAYKAIEIALETARESEIPYIVFHKIVSAYWTTQEAMIRFPRIE
jgi:hypothetical protein